MTRDEDHLQYEIVMEAQRRGIYFFSVPNDSAGLSARAMMRRVSMGLRKGAADLVLVLPGNVIFLEVKKPDGTQSTDQKRFQGKIEELGHRYEIVRSLEEFKALADCLGYAAK